MVNPVNLRMMKKHYTVVCGMGLCIYVKILKGNI